MSISGSTSGETSRGRPGCAEGLHAESANPVPTERLLSVVTRIEDFLLRQVQRLEILLENSRTAAKHDAAAELLAAELLEERRKWESTREQQTRRLEAEAARLVEAWQRLEAEQRRVLAQRESPRPARETSPEVPTGRGVYAREHDRVRRSSDQSPCPAVAEVGGDDEPLLPELAAMQFQQLRHEILRHRRQER